MGEINRVGKYKDIKHCYFIPDGLEIIQQLKPEHQASFDYISPSINKKVIISISDKAIQKLPFLNTKDLEKISRTVIKKVKDMNGGEFIVDTKFIDDTINFKSL